MESNGKFTLIVFNTCTREYEEVMVTEEVYRTVAAERWRHIALGITAFCAGFPMGTRWCFFTIERPEQMCYNDFENVLEDKEEGVTEA